MVKATRIDLDMQDMFQLYIYTVGPYLCFISFLYLDLYLLGDDASIS